MYSVMLVDDDVLVRIGLKSVTDWNSKGLQIVAEASGGLDAFELLKRYKPDIIITDMYMPDFDGIHLIREGRKICPNSVFVVLSCHNDIEYIKEAIRAGAYDYLLKSSIVDSLELDGLLHRIITILDMQRGDARPEKADPVHNKVSLPASNEKELLLDFLGEKNNRLQELKQYLIQKHVNIESNTFFLTALAIDNYEKAVENASVGKLLHAKIEESISEIINEYGKNLIFYWQNGIYFVLLNIVVSNGLVSPKSKMLSICERLRINIKNNFLRTCSVYVEDGQSLENLPEVFRSITQEIQSTGALNFDSVVDIIASTASVYDHATDEKDDESANPINEITDYIQSNYRSNISLDMLADLFHFSKYHLCRKFKETTSMTIIDYLIQVRIKKAKELLKSAGNRHIFEIASEVGFNDPSYFNRVFKKITMLTPNEYQNNYMVDKEETH